MTKHIFLSLQLAILAAICVSCIQTSITTGQDAKDAADATLQRYCARVSEEECAALKFLSASDFQEKWLVEYESERYSYAVIVDRSGSAEITRSEKANEGD